MFRFLMIFLLIAVCIASLAYYRGWFHVESDKADGNSRITITTDNEQIKKDRDSVMDHMPGSSQPSKNETPASKGKD